jgi:hypothetical protein
MQKFKLYPEKHNKQYYEVIIFDREENMFKYSNSINRKMDHNFQAVAHSYDAYYKYKKKMKRSPLIGSILFYKNNFGVGVVSHELAHATTYYFGKHKIKFQIGNKPKPTEDWKKKDEAYSHILGHMVNQFWKKYNGRIKTKSEDY